MRIFASIFVLAALGVGAYAFASSSQSEGPTSTPAQTVEQQANAALVAANFQAAATQLEEYRATNATYEGATVSAAPGVTLVRADAAGYCIQAGAGTEVQHEVGPGGSPVPGPC